MSKDTDSTFAAPTEQPAVARVPWQPAVGVFFVIAIFFLSQVISGLLVSIYPALHHQHGQQAVDWLNNSVTAQFMYILFAEGLIIAAIWQFLRRYKLGLAAIGLKRPRLDDVLYGVALVVPYFILYAVTVGLVSHVVSGLNVNQTQQIGFDNVHGSLSLVLTFLSLAVLPPIAEEIVVRGFLYSTLKKAMPTLGAVLLTSALFAAAHLGEGGAAGPLYIAALDTFVLSLVLIYLREKTGSLWASITLHAIKNGIAFVALFVIHVR